MNPIENYEVHLLSSFPHFHKKKNIDKHKCIEEEGAVERINRKIYCK